MNNRTPRPLLSTGQPGPDWLNSTATVLEWIVTHCEGEPDSPTRVLRIRLQDADQIRSSIETIIHEHRALFPVNRSVRDATQTVRELTGKPLGDVLAVILHAMKDAPITGLPVVLLGCIVDAAAKTVPVLRRHARPTLGERAGTTGPIESYESERLGAPEMNCSEVARVEQGVIDEEPGRQPVQPLHPVDGDWLIPTSLADIANRLDNMTPERAKDLLAQYGLQKRGRQRWTVRLDMLPGNIRTKLERQKS